MRHFIQLSKRTLLFSLVILAYWQKVAATTQKQPDEKIEKKELVALIQGQDLQEFNNLVDSNCDKKFFDQKYKDNEGLIHLLAQYDKNGTKTAYLFKKAKEAKIKFGINVIKQQGKKHCLHIAVENDNLAFIQQMRQYQLQQREDKKMMTLLKVNIKNQDKKTPKQIAHEQDISNKNEIIEILTQMGTRKKTSKKSKGSHLSQDNTNTTLTDLNKSPHLLSTVIVNGGMHKPKKKSTAIYIDSDKEEEHPRSVIRATSSSCELSNSMSISNKRGLGITFNDKDDSQRSFSQNDNLSPIFSGNQNSNKSLTPPQNDTESKQGFTKLPKLVDNDTITLRNDDSDITPPPTKSNLTPSVIKDPNNTTIDHEKNNDTNDNPLILGKSMRATPLTPQKKITSSPITQTSTVSTSFNTPSSVSYSVPNGGTTRVISECMKPTKRESFLNSQNVTTSNGDRKSLSGLVKKPMNIILVCLFGYIIYRVFKRIWKEFVNHRL